MTIVSLASQLVQETKAALYAKALEIATDLGLPVTSWQAGDPTRSLYHILSETLATLEAVVANYVASGFLDYAQGDWLKLTAKQVYGVDVPGATFATTTERLTNAGGGVYDFDAGDITFKNSSTDKTYRNTTGGHLGAGGTLDVTVVADEAGSDSSAGVGEIDELVDVLLGVTCSNATAAVGIDEPSASEIVQLCRDAQSATSPNGAAAAYRYVALNSTLTGSTETTRVRVIDSSTTGDVTVYIAGAAGAVSGGTRAAVEAAIIEWCTPLCITPTITSASNVVVAVTYELWVYESTNRTEAEVEADVEAALEAMFAARPIGGDVIPPATTGKLYQSMIASTIKAVYPTDAFRVAVTIPAADTALTIGQVATLGAVTPTVHIVAAP